MQETPIHSSNKHYAFAIIRYTRGTLGMGGATVAACGLVELHSLLVCHSLPRTRLYTSTKQLKTTCRSEEVGESASKHHDTTMCRW